MSTDFVYEEAVKLARHLCEEDGKNPDDWYQEFNRNAHMSDPEYEDPVIYYWEEYMSVAYTAVSFIYKSWFPVND